MFFNGFSYKIEIKLLKEEYIMTEEMNEVMNEQGLNEGDIVTGVVTKIEEKAVIVEIAGAPLDGIIPISELSSLHIEKAEDAVQVGEELQLKITKVEEDNYVLSKSAVDAEKAWDGLIQSFEAGEILETEVKEVVKGGLVLDLGVRGFVPASLVEDHFVESFDDYQGKTMTFKIVELDRDENRLILSHRAVVEAEKAEQKGKLLDRLETGQVLTGTVQRIAAFGAFVDLGGIDGLVHISQLSHDHVSNVSDVVTEGQEVKVKVLAVDPETERISLSIKETQPGPWEQLADRIQEGDVLEGTVKRLVSYGAFVEVFPHIEGLVHISRISHDHISTPSDVLEEGQTVQVKVLDLNTAEQRLSLSIRDLIEKEDDYKPEDLPEEATGFSFGDVIGDQLKKLTE